MSDIQRALIFGSHNQYLQEQKEEKMKKKRFHPFPQIDLIKWADWNRKRSTIIQSKKPYAKRMEEELELEKKLEEEREKNKKC